MPPAPHTVIATMKQFERLFEPRSIAVVGVSEDPARPGSQAVHALLRNGYAGRIYPVNPKYPELRGHEVLPVDVGDRGAKSTSS